MAGHRDLFIWRESVDLAVRIVQLTDGFPHHQRHVLVEQMQRAAVSVPSNLSEGKGRLSQRDLRRHVGIARGSLYELDTQTEIAARLGLLTPSCKQELDGRIATLSSGINALLKRLDKSSTAP